VESAAPASSVEDVRRIAALGNPIVRNLEITQCYSRLSTAFAARGGGGANWCTYATWASRQAGRTIRGEDALDEVERKVHRGRWVLRPAATLGRRLLRRGLFQPETRLGRLVAELHTPFDAVERASAAVARGNLKVFEEIGLEFARFLAESPPDGEDSAALERFLGGLRDGDPPDGQQYLRRAFARYERARRADDPRTRAQLTVLANLEIGFHEQTRLQPEIGEALDAPFVTQERLGLRALEALVPSLADAWSVIRVPASAVAGAFAAGVQRASSRLAREVITESFMVLTLPGRVLTLGTHLGDVYPDGLGDPRDADLAELLARFEPAPPAADDCGARDWADLHQRMHYIVHLFCAFHEREELFDAPFTPAQVAAFERGRLPDGEL
jgi:hypothetical protein